MSMLTFSDTRHTGKYEAGFTLIELSIVLVIIGLIVGGILTGQDLIKAAEQRATLAQIEKYNTAVNTFRNKYNGIPGDLSEATAVSFGIYAMSTAGTVGGTGFGDGNGLIQDPNATNANNPVGETLGFWRHLSDANLIDGSFGSLLTTAGQAAATAGTNIPGNYAPLAKLGRSNYIIVGSSNTEGYNFYVVGGLGGTFTVGAAGTAVWGSPSADTLNPLEAYNMDKKVDDGAPGTGTVQARSNTNIGGAAATPADDPLQSSATGTSAVPSNTTTAGTASKCTYTTGGVTTYNVQTISPACSMRFRFN